MRPSLFSRASLKIGHKFTPSIHFIGSRKPLIEQASKFPKTSSSSAAYPGLGIIVQTRPDSSKVSTSSSASSASSTSSASSSVVIESSVFDLPIKYRYPVLSELEIEAIESGGASLFEK
ncbi:hypothetical protein BB560_005239 [Smittium megazygosporum]|uniref:Uncharacterized protein n=1 Tax=Smittium megazygosporum TaxID=133381 RepID=A0A2T9Z765_9FUNG|nr:hypothetical protein BB560_005239 [Smittium megazygosporum]